MAYDIAAIQLLYGAKLNVKNKFGWTPLAIAVGYRFGNFKPSPETEAAIREVMLAAHVTSPETITVCVRSATNSTMTCGSASM